MKNLRIIRIVVLTASLSVLGACSTGREIDESRIDKYKKGVTTEREVRTDFGQPGMITVNSDGSKVETYRNVSKKISGASFIFDTDGLLRAFSIYGAPPG